MSRPPAHRTLSLRVYRAMREKGAPCQRERRFSGRRVRVWCGEVAGTGPKEYWRPDGTGYTDRPELAGTWLFEEAVVMTWICGREKKIFYELVTNPVVPATCSRSQR